MIRISVQRIGDHKYTIRNVNGRGFSDVLNFYEKAGVLYKYATTTWRTQRQARFELARLARLASRRTGGAFEFIGE